MLPVTLIEISVTVARSTRVLETYRGKVVLWRDANNVEKVICWQDELRRSWFIIPALANDLYLKLTIKVQLFDYLILQA